MDLMVNPVITDFRQDVNGDIKMLKLGVKKEDAYANITGQVETADLENNKAATINVSTYTQPVEVTPTAGKDGMKKATITLSHIPVGVSALYAWTDAGGVSKYTLSSTPQVGDVVLYPTENTSKIDTTTVTSISEGVLNSTYERDTDNDISLT